MGISPVMSAIIPLIDSVYLEVAGRYATCTSCRDGKHKGLPHYLGYAFDLRTRGDNDTEQWSDGVKNGISNRLSSRLPLDFDVVVESTHIHLEYDPRV